MSEMAFIEENHDAWLTDLKELLAINSIRDDQHADQAHPFGPGPKAALDKMLTFAKRDGFDRTGNVANKAGYIEIGPKDAKQTVGILIHVDVVPVDRELWDSDPFVPKIVGSRLYARGADDMKGSDMLVYYALKALKDQAGQFKNKVRLIIGTDEENDWDDMASYFAAEGRPDLGFSPDGDFIVENAEKGIAHLDLLSDSDSIQTDKNEPQLLSFQAGKASNIVPGVATADVLNLDAATVQIDFQKFLADQGITGSLAQEGTNSHFVLNGFSVHGSVPDEGKNAATYLALFLSQYSFEKTAARWLDFLGHVLHQDYFGEQLGIGVTTKDMGKTTLNAGIIDWQAGHQAVINLNLRYPVGFHEHEAARLVSDRFPWITAKAEGDGMAPHLLSSQDPVVTSLLRIYKEVAGKETHLNVSAGASFGRLMPRGVCYGTRFIGQSSTAHQKNEYFHLSNYEPAMKILIRSIKALAMLD